MKYLFYSLRPAQWVKNFFIFIPLIFGKRVFDYSTDVKTVLAFFVLCMMASVVYLINDIIDINKDKVHPVKRLRPIASGKVSISTAGLAVLILGITSVILSFTLDPYFGIVMTVFLAGNVLYSMVLKNVVIIDLFCIAFFFYLRIKAGSIVAMVDLSHWIIFMVFFLALFLGLNKRLQELKLFSRKAHPRHDLSAHYNIDFIERIASLVTTSILVVYMLYTVDARTVKQFGSDHLMYSIPFVYYGVFRYQYLIGKIKDDGDPTRILLSDRTMRINIILWLGVCMAVIYCGL